MRIPFDNSYATLPEGFYTRVNPTPTTSPKLLSLNDTLAKSLGIEDINPNDATQVFSGNAIPDGASPLAQLYSGHQFGNYNPQLGDGRAILLGETLNNNGLRRDIQLKGSGRTPYSRGGDGRAWIGPVLREYVISEAMHALGIPTTRALAAVATGDDILREQGMLPGAVLTRVASSHLRVGTFQVFAHRGQTEDLQILTDYAISRHYPDADRPLGLLRAVCAKQADLIAAWMSVGFIHGVMNTDNCSISGETIDYGPCAFMDDFHMAMVFSSIDRQSRYAYGNQPNMAMWNMAQLATALLQLAEDQDAALEEATAIIHAMPDQIETAWLARFGAKIGLQNPTEKDTDLIQSLLDLMQKDGADFTNTFRSLSGEAARDQFADRERFDAWSQDHKARLANEPDPIGTMDAVNPAVIPRNHRMEQMIEAATAGDMEPFNRLMNALAAPYTLTDTELANPPSPSEQVAATFCGN